MNGYTVSFLDIAAPPMPSSVLESMGIPVIALAAAAGIVVAVLAVVIRAVIKNARK